MAMIPMNRRRFLTTAAATLAIPTILPRSVFGANERVSLGYVGVKNRGGQNLGEFLKLKDVEHSAFCDVDSKVLGEAVSHFTKKGAPKPNTFGDYRQLLDRKDVDAVVVSVPDHWHALVTIQGCQAGKDVYCEKPLSLTVSEGRKMVEAARAHKRVVQTGSQQRSDKRFRLACELVRSGKLGKLETVLVGIPAVNWSGPPVPDSAPPAELDYDFWLGPAPKKPYNAKHVHYNFRFYWDYSGGQMTNFGAHHLDIAQWALDMDASGPVHIEATARFHPEHWYEVPMSSHVTYTYANGVTVKLGQNDKDYPQGCTFLGSEGKIFVDRSKIVSTPTELARQELSASDVHLYDSRNHYRNFVDCVKSRKTPICDVEIGHRSATVCHLGNIAIRSGRKIQWDPSAETIVGDDAANAMLARPYRSPWTI